MKKIIFVCTGNTCRSPIAEAYAKEKSKNYAFYSRGIFAQDQMPASDNMLSIASHHELDLTKHRSKNIKEEDLENLHYILTMTEHHKQYLIEQYPQLQHKIMTLKEAAGHDTLDIPDPYLGSEKDYEFAFSEIKKAIDDCFFRTFL